MTQPQFISLADAAERFGVSPKTIRRRIADGNLTGYRMGQRTIRLKVDELDAVLRRIPSGADAAA